MAIKLEIPQSGQRGQTFEAAPLQDPTRGFGNVVAKPVSLPTEDVRGNTRAILQTGESAAQTSATAAKAINSAVSYLQQHAEAEDKVKAAQIENEMIVKHAEIDKRNQERVLKGEITLAQVADENRKALETEYSALIENTPFNFGTTRDTLRVSASKRMAVSFAEDTDNFVKKNTQNAIDAYNLRIDTVAQSMNTDPGAFQRGMQSFEELRKDPLYQLRPAVYEAAIDKAKRSAAGQMLTTLAKENPDKFFQYQGDGTLDVFKDVITPDQMSGFKNDAENTITIRANQEFAQRNRLSNQTRDDLYLKLVQDPNAVSISEISANPNLEPADKAVLINHKNQIIQTEQSKNKDIIEIQNAINAANGSGVGLTGW
ncbi:hypothetical protein [Methylomonas koyamae]|uniref:hypothetical protein n=2 Tax=Methylomonas koyamae TaxID=702114 RepID=UPI001C32A715|nr:hypothetical protein [Methylomonas koyamae]BBL57006.1 hypothetical protein MKFW12EY_06190 [Methylomonas koyamae]